MAKDKLLSPGFCYILAANFLLFFAFYLILPVLPFYLSHQFATGKSMIGFILSCYTLAALCIRPFAGYLLDTFSRRPLYLVAYFIFTAIFAGYMVATTLFLFIALRIVHGLAFGMVTVSGNTIVIDILPSSRRGEGIGYYGLANNIAMSFGPMIGLFMQGSFSYETIFSCSLISGALGLLMAYRVKTPYKQPVKREPLSQGVAFGTMFPAFNTLFVNLAPNNQRGTATSTYLTSWDVGIGIGLMIGGTIAQAFGGFSYAYFTGACLTIVSTLFFLLKAGPHFNRAKLR